MCELKNCPFCGSEDAYSVYLPDPYSRDQYAWVNCKTCNASGGQFVQRVCPDDKSFSRNEMELESTKLWNTRPIEDALRKRIAELETKIRHNALWQASEDSEERALLEKLVPDLKKRIAELEAELGKDVDLTIVGLRKELLNAQSRIAELEAEIDQLTAHDATERQDDKSPNDTQTQTFVYGKEREE